MLFIASISRFQHGLYENDGHQVKEERDCKSQILGDAWDIMTIACNPKEDASVQDRDRHKNEIDCPEKAGARQHLCAQLIKCLPNCGHILDGRDQDGGAEDGGYHAGRDIRVNKVWKNIHAR